jgi:hypothetical protein
MRYLCAALIAALAGAGEMAWAYEEGIVSEGGALVGIVTLEGAAKVDLTIPAPTGRLYANEMVDKPYTRYGITDDAQSHIVPTLIRQER